MFFFQCFEHLLTLKPDMSVINLIIVTDEKTL